MKTAFQEFENGIKQGVLKLVEEHMVIECQPGPYSDSTNIRVSFPDLPGVPQMGILSVLDTPSETLSRAILECLLEGRITRKGLLSRRPYER